jgi:hypothetical protein
MRTGLESRIAADALRSLHIEVPAINHRETLAFAWNFILVLGHGEGRFLPVYNTMLVEQQLTTAQEMGTMACIPKKGRPRDTVLQP